MTARVLVLLLVAVAGLRTAGAAPLLAEPQVKVVEAPVNGVASGPLTLRNDDDTATIEIQSITPEPGCDPAVQLAPLGPLTLGPRASRTLTVTCAAAPAGMQRCHYRVRAPSKRVLLDLEAVCASAGSATLSADATAVDFASVIVGTSMARTISLTNTGAATLDRLFIQTTDLDGNFAVGDPCNPDARECDAPIPSLPAGGTRSISVACTPRTAAAVSAQLYVTSSAGTRLGGPIALSCAGAPASTPVLSAVPTAVDVGAVEVRDGVALTTVVLRNAGAGMMQLLDVQIVDGGTGAAADWKVTAHAPCSAGIPPSCTLDTGLSTELDLTFDPSVIGARNATLLIQFHDTADRSLSIPLRGLGQGVTLEVVGRHTILDFGTLPLNTSARLEIQVANRGTRTLTGATLALEPAGPPFSASPGPTFNVPATTPTTITVTCTATSAAPATATLRLASDDVAGDPIELALRCTGDAATTLIATPPALLLGEVRLDTPRVFPFDVTAVTGTITLTSATLQTPIPGLSIRGLPATTPASLDLAAAPESEGALTDQLVVTGSSGTLRIPVTGTAALADYAVPGMVSLGTFCVGQPTNSRAIRLTSTGSAAIGLLTPTLQNPESPYDLELIAPIAYPATLPALGTAVITATPKRRDTRADVLDTVLWKSDVTGKTVATTTLTAGFIDEGGATSPDMLRFDPAPIHLAIPNAQEVAIKNCDASPLQLDPPVVPAPFSIDSPNFPTVLGPRETATFSVGFHPTKLEPVTRTLVITSPQLTKPLLITMMGEGKISGDGEGSEVPNSDDIERTSFYACGGCGAGGAGGALALGTAALVLLIPRRRRAR